MRVLYVIDSVGTGGAETQLLRASAYLSRAGFQQAVVQLFPESDLAGDFRSLDIPLFQFGYSRRLASLPFVFPRVLAAARNWRPDLMWTHLPSSDIIGRLVSRRLGLPSISTWHSTLYDFERMPDRRFKIRIGTSIYRQLDRLTAPYASRYVAVSTYARDSYCHALSVPREKVSVVPNSVELKRYASISRVPSDSGHMRLIHIGRHVPDKGIDILLDAIAKMRRKESVSLELIGKGPQTEALRSICAKLGIAEQVKFHGVVRDIVPHLANATLMVMPSYREGQGIAFLEALASGLPIVASDIPAFREIDPREAATQFFKPGDSDGLARVLDQLTDQPSALDQLASKARELARPFDIEVIGPKLAELIRSASRG